MTAMILGVHQDAKPAAVTTRFPGATWGREFVSKPGGGPLPESTTEEQLVAKVMAKVKPHLDAGGGCVVSIKMDMTSVGKGRWDSRLVAVGAVLDGSDVEVVLWHEPEDDLKANVFVPAHNRGREAIQEGGRGVPVDYVGMTYQWRPGSPTTADAKAWAKDLVADRLLADVYFGKTFSSKLNLGTHPGFQRWLNEMVLPFDGIWGLGEWGRQAEANRPAGFEADFEWLATDLVGSTCSMALVWGTGGTEGDPGWLLDDPAAAVIQAGFERLSSPVLPTGYRQSELSGILVSERSGCLVASDLTSKHDELLRSAGA